MLIVMLIAFVGLFAWKPELIRRCKDAGPTIVGWVVAIGVAGWILGALLQTCRYGAVMAPYGQ